VAERRADAARTPEAPDIAELTEQDWDGFDRVVGALARRTVSGLIEIPISGGRACDFRCGARVHIEGIEKPSLAVQRWLRGAPSPT
jgi:hypothetical protein